MSHTKTTSRREFLKNSAVAGAAVAGGLSLARSAHAQGSDQIRIALIGCGGRGTGAAVNALNNKANPNVKLVAMADAFRNRLDGSLGAISRRCKDKVDVPEDRKFVGLDAYKGVMAGDADMVLLTTPPGFRPMQFEAAVKAGKHIFSEKPVATDGPGVRKFMAANEEAKKKKLLVAVGHHLRHEEKHKEAVKRIHDGQIGDLMFTRVYFNTGRIWVRRRKPEQTEMQYQVYNWYHFTWLSGDHIVEQHVHDLDVGNWFNGDRHPIEAEGMGGRQVCKTPDHGEIYDHHAVEYTYENGVKMFSYCRQINGCWNNFAEHASGTKGHADIQGHGTAVLTVDGKEPMKWKRTADGHQTEHDDLFAALMAGKEYNEGDRGAEGTMTAILGRMATYSGKVVKWDEGLNSTLDLMPKKLTWDAETPIKPRPDGTYACATPGATKAW